MSEKNRPIGPVGDEPTVPLRDDAAAAAPADGAAQAAPDEPTARLDAAEPTARVDAAEPTARLDAAEPATAPDVPEPEAARSPYEPLVEPDDAAADEDGADRDAPDAPAGDTTARKRLSGAGALIGVLLVLLGFTLAVQLKSNSADEAYTAMREEDLYVILADLDSREDRLQLDIAALQESRRELASGAANREQILKEAQERADDLGILAGTLPAKGPGVTVRLENGSTNITAAHLLNAVQELRGAGAEAIQIDGSGGSVRVVASSHFVNSPGGGVEVDGVRLNGPYTITAIGPADIAVAMRFRGGVVDDVEGDGGNVIVSEPGTVDISTVRNAPTLEYAKPVS